MVRVARATFLSLMVPALLLLACGGGGGDGSSSEAQTTIEGRVTNVDSPAATSGLSGPQVGGIVVEARRGGDVLDVATTGTDGRFTLEFAGGGAVQLSFATADSVLTLEVNAPPGSVFTLVVELRLFDREVVVLEEGQSVRCRDSSSSIIDEDLDLLIDGRGGDCLHAENACELELVLHSLTLVNCDRCIVTESSSEIRIRTFPGGFTCEARDDGIRAESSSFISVDAADVEIVSRGGRGISARSSSDVVLGGGLCFIESAGDPIQTESQAVVDLDACDDVSLVGDPGDDDDVFGDDDDEFGNNGNGNNGNGNNGNGNNGNGNRPPRGRFNP